MNESLLEKLQSQIEDASWEMLKSHEKRGGFVLISEDLNLAEVGVCVATDQVDQVKLWLESGELKKPTPRDVAVWEGQPEKRFRFIIVQPYVLVQVAPQ